MDFTYKKIVISVNSNGMFEFTYNGESHSCESLRDSKELIDYLVSSYYQFTKSDLNKLLEKLDNREQDFVKSLITELNCHSDNAYCELSITDAFLFTLPSVE